jgi:hypothetical protein
MLRLRTLKKSTSALPSALVAVLAVGCSSDPELGQTQAAYTAPSLVASDVDCKPQVEPAYSGGQAIGNIDVIHIGDKPVARRTAGAFLVLRQRAAEAGVTVTINSGFRTMDEQQYFYDCYRTGKCNNGNLAARPGYSNHQDGRALDLSGSTGALDSVIAKNGLEWQRTVEGEPWHYEYVGADVDDPCGGSTTVSEITPVTVAQQPQLPPASSDPPVVAPPVVPDPTPPASIDPYDPNNPYDPYRDPLADPYADPYSDPYGDPYGYGYGNDPLDSTYPGGPSDPSYPSDPASSSGIPATSPGPTPPANTPPAAPPPNAQAPAATAPPPAYAPPSPTTVLAAPEADGTYKAPAPATTTRRRNPPPLDHGECGVAYLGAHTSERAALDWMLLLSATGLLVVRQRLRNRWLRSSMRAQTSPPFSSA